MKLLTLIIALVLAGNVLLSQEKFVAPELTDEQKCEVLYSHVVAYAVSGISFAKSQGLSPEEYGRYIGKKFSAYWNPEDGFPVLVTRMMYILAGLHPDNQMQIVKQSGKSITFQLMNVDLSFKQGPMFDVTYQDFLNCSYGIIEVIAHHMNATFSQSTTADGWYIATLSQK
ncbi:hypothetical protein INQ51_01965 [Maribellus sp. CM-23]|uniref:hypothetical protein n=1 Tax=Maribellus sp. CM-23 TaxID=2781026 RepID=UPI001F3DFB16|nr:hypothetical protein [Maribellus sp. CM-23]MCE4563066.1 hypothetical protein [Maribellus sp. CM-23]